MDILVAHVGGIPIEETLGSLGPALLLVAGAALARLNSRVRHRGGGTSGVEVQVSADRPS